jgi:hypothetical protein
MIKDSTPRISQKEKRISFKVVNLFMIQLFSKIIKRTIFMVKELRSMKCSITTSIWTKSKVRKKFRFPKS